MPDFTAGQSDSGKHIVFAGGGHAHVHVLKAFASQPERNVRITLISRDSLMLYSGMLPGVIAGLYDPKQAEIDLRQLAAETGTAFVQAVVNGIDRQAKRVCLTDGKTVSYDLLSIDVGITPALGQIEGAKKHAIAVKPIGSFLQKLLAVLERCRRPGGSRCITVIGGGAGGVELLLSLRTRILAEARKAGLNANAFAFALVTQGEVLATHNRRVRSAFRRMLRERGISLQEYASVVRVCPGRVELENGASIPADEILVTTGAAAPSWFRFTGLTLDDSGFLATGPTLQVMNDQDVFAAGDCATLIETPREKAGVFAVRAGPPLARNLRRRVRGEALQRWYPQQQHLAIISAGERYAVASHGPFKLEGAWLWSVKDWIDQRWIRQYPRPRGGAV